MIEGYYAKLKTGITLYEFEWSADSVLSIKKDNGTKEVVDSNDYEIVLMTQITAND